MLAENDGKKSEALQLDNNGLQILIDQNNELRKQNMQLEGSLNQILNSKSWRLTESLRRVAAGIRKLFPLLCFRKIKLRLVPGRNVVQNGDIFTVAGASPTIFVESLSSRLPCRWVSLRATFTSERNPLFFLLYFGKDGDYNPVNRVWLTLNAEDGDEQCFRIPEWSTHLRLDPFDTDFSFSVERLEARELGKLQVAYRIFKKQMGPALRHPRVLIGKLAKLFSVMKEGGLTALKIKLFADNYTSNYQEWVNKYDTLNEVDRKLINEKIPQLSFKPLISIIMPVYNVPEKWLRAAIDSVERQLYRNWELCITDDASTEGHVRKVLEEYKSRNPRIKVVYREKNGHISAASNSALAIASGQYIALLDNDDELTEHALYMVVEAINKNPHAALIYSDEDKITSYGMRFNPYFKPDYNPALLLQQNYICHFSVYNAEVVKKLGGFRTGLEGAQDWDLALRVCESAEANEIVHVPHVLYHWRVIEGSTAQSTSHKPYVMEAQARSVREYLERSGQGDAQVSIREDISQLRVKFPVPSSNPKVSIIIPSKNQVGYLKRCVSSITDLTTYSNFEILIVDNGSTEKDALEYLDSLACDARIKVIRDNSPFNFSALNNRAVLQSSGEVLAFLNNDLEVISKEWLGEMLSQLFQSGVGAAGAKLYYPNDLLQHGGVVLGIGGVAGHSHKGRVKQDPGYFNRCILNQNVSAVTAACMLIKKTVFEEIGGFDEESLAVAFNDVDLCLKVRKAGYLITYCAFAELYHFESVSRGFENTPQKFSRFEKEITVMKKRWKDILESDPYYNPNLTLITEDYSFAFPPRARKPWREG